MMSGVRPRSFSTQPLRAVGARLLVLAALLLVGGQSRVEAAPWEGQLPRGLTKGPKRTKEFNEAVNRAIDRGVAWLRKQQDPDGRFRRGIHPGARLSAPLRKFGVQDPLGHGPTALGVLTLRICGVAGDDVGVRRGLDALREGYPTGRGFTDGVTVYGTSLTLLALEAHYEPEESGARAIPDGDRAWIEWLVRELRGAQTSTGGFGYYGPNSSGPATNEFGSRSGYWDNSNSQFALLGLAAAQRCGVKPDEDLWLRALRHWLNQQERKGPEVARYEESDVAADGDKGRSLIRQVGTSRARGWSYSKDAEVPSGSMTAGGVSSIALCRGALSDSIALRGPLDRQSRSAMHDGLAWLGHHFRVDVNPMGVGNASVPLFQYYYLYGLERAGVLADTAWMADRDWYGVGAEYLVREQRADGSWEESAVGAGAQVQDLLGRMPLLDTCFALLFLKRSSSRLCEPTSSGRPTATPR